VKRPRSDPEAGPSRPGEGKVTTSKKRLPRSRLQLSKPALKVVAEAASELLLTTEFGKKYKDVIKYRCVLCVLLCLETTCSSYLLINNGYIITLSLA
jgi:hypothetical protein